MQAVSFIFEVMKGCQMACSGCRINKEISAIPDEATLDKLYSLFTGLKSQGVMLDEIEIAPSDILSARNKNEVFTDTKVVDLINQFSLLTVNASFVYADEEPYEWLAKKIAQTQDRPKLRLVIPLEMSHVFNAKYISRIKQNLAVFQSYYPNELYGVALNIIFDERFIQNPLNKFSYEELFTRTNSFVNDIEFHPKGARVDYVFHHGRENLDNPLLAQNFITSLKELYRHHFTDHGQSRDVPRFLRFDEEADEIVYHDGDLYIRPVINDRLSVFHESLRYTGQWESTAIIEHLAERFNENLVMASSFQDCSTCSKMVECSKRYTQDLMQILKTQECITLLKQYES